MSINLFWVYCYIVDMQKQFTLKIFSLMLFLVRTKVWMEHLCRFWLPVQCATNKRVLNMSFNKGAGVAARIEHLTWSHAECKMIKWLINYTYGWKSVWSVSLENRMPWKSFTHDGMDFKFPPPFQKALSSRCFTCICIIKTGICIASTLSTCHTHRLYLVRLCAAV